MAIISFILLILYHIEAGSVKWYLDIAGRACYNAGMSFEKGQKPSGGKYMHSGTEITGDDLGLASALVPSIPSESDLEHKVYHPNRIISDEEQDAMLKEWAAGGNMKAVMAKYGVHGSYLRVAMRKRFGSLEGMKQALLGLVTENAIVSQMVAAEKMHELTGAQAVFSGKLLVETMLNVEKSIANTPKTIDFAQMKKVGDAIKHLREIVGKPVSQ